MNKFGLKIGLFCLILITIAKVTTAYLPYHWGNPWYSTKINYLNNLDSANYNTYFFGTSRIYRQINPVVFDSICNISCKETISSFNLGAQATFSPQSYYLYEKFLNSELNKDVKYCFLELTHISFISDFFLHREQTNYWLDLSELKFVINSFINNPHVSLKNKKKQLKRYVLSYIENTIHWGHFGEHIMNSNFYDTRYLGKLKNGFFPMDLDFETTNDKFVKDHYQLINNTMLNDTSILNKNFEISKSHYNNISKDYDKAHYNRLLSLIDLSKKKGINLILLLSPRNSSKDLLKLMQMIPEDNKIDMAIPLKENKPYYTISNSFDRGHLNSNGANLYSEGVAKKFSTIIN
jgi:hypothetical protein